ncbi:MAG: hypothetical protein HSCHL_2396 [Hydrogenibacillus schlegelii]|uniref:PEGA domain-containing protein n=3 Tax=Hydrogenibacillus schlegelii TaxID=1484 RepID=A0A2T5GF65_HYDSH|nr:hypothetical protein [Hydrogenibacillus schlegelii]PTQ54805.1 MAG: hypothetical protein HSCHL_2396 [Hydrogenibacillus schlegelii]
MSRIVRPIGAFWLAAFALMAWVGFSLRTVLASPLRTAEGWVAAAVGGKAMPAIAFPVGLDGEALRSALRAALREDASFRAAAIDGIRWAAREGGAVFRPAVGWRGIVHPAPTIAWPAGAVRVPALQPVLSLVGAAEGWTAEARYNAGGVRMPLSLEPDGTVGPVPAVPGRLEVELRGPLGAWRMARSIAGAAAWELGGATAVLQAEAPAALRLTFDAPAAEAWIDGRGAGTVVPGAILGPLPAGEHAVRLVRRDPWGTSEASATVRAPGEATLHLDRFGEAFRAKVFETLGRRYRALEEALRGEGTAGDSGDGAAWTPAFGAALAERLGEVRAAGAVYGGRLHRAWVDPASIAVDEVPEGGLMVRLRAVLEYAAAPVWWMPEPPDVRPGAPADAVPGETAGPDGRSSGAVDSADGAGAPADRLRPDGRSGGALRGERVTLVFSGGVWRLDDLEAESLPAPFAEAAGSGPAVPGDAQAAGPSGPGEAPAVDRPEAGGRPAAGEERAPDRLAARAAQAAQRAGWTEVPVGEAVVVGVDAYAPPAVERRGDRLFGREVERWTEAARRSGTRLVFVDVPPGAAPAALRAGAIDAYFGGFSEAALRRLVAGVPAAVKGATGGAFAVRKGWEDVPLIRAVESLFSGSGM